MFITKRNKVWIQGLETDLTTLRNEIETVRHWTDLFYYPQTYEKESNNMNINEESITYLGYANDIIVVLKSL